MQLLFLCYNGVVNSTFKGILNKKVKMPKDFEISIGDYGRMVFELFLEENWSNIPDHWNSIKKEALPLVKKLIKLNDKMEGGGYGSGSRSG